MPATFTVDPERRLVLSRAWGRLEDADLRATQDGVRADARFAPDFRQLYDFSAVSEVCVTGEGMRLLAQRSPFAPDARRAFVVGTDEAFGLVRMYQLLTDRDPVHFRIFRDRETALAWLGALDDASDDGAG